MRRGAEAVGRCHGHFKGQSALLPDTRGLLLSFNKAFLDAGLWICRLLSLKANYPAKLGHDWADLQAAAAQAPERLRLAFLMGGHNRYASIPTFHFQQMISMPAYASCC